MTKHEFSMTWLPKMRYESLRRYCLHFSKWEEKLKTLEEGGKIAELYCKEPGAAYIDPTAKVFELKASYTLNMNNIIQSAKEASPEYAYLIVESVIHDGGGLGTFESPYIRGLSYKELVRDYGLTLSQDEWYDIRRWFFYYLNKKVPKHYVIY